MSDEMRLLSLLVQTGLHKKQNDQTGKIEQGRNIPAMLVGFPGIGKTQLVLKLGEQMAKATNKPYPVEVFTCPQRMPEEIGGIPVADIEAKEVHCLPMSIGKKLLQTGQGIFFFDEYSSADQAMGGACMTAIQDGRMGDMVLPHSVARVAAMNPPECAANGRGLTAPEANRFCFIPWTLTFGDWANYMMGGPGTLSNAVVLPENWETDNAIMANSLVVSYLKRNQERFNVENTMPKAHDANRPWASPRSWENATRILAACASVKERADSDLAYLGLKGVLGEGDADAFLTWFRDMDLPDPEELLAMSTKKAQAQLPTRPDKLQVALESLANAACRDNPKITKRWEKAWAIIHPVLEKTPDNALYAAKTLSLGINKVPDAETPPGARLVRDLLKSTGLK